MPQSKTQSASKHLAKPSYHHLAQYYDQLFLPFQSEIMKKARRVVLGRILPQIHTACDLGAGTGSAALQMSAHGIRVYAVDLSSGMCRMARRKVRLAHATVKVIHADMRSFRLPQQVNLVTCEGDALNHIPRQSDLARVARSVFRALRPGGWFFFDVNNSLGFQRYWIGTVCFEKPGLVLMMRNAHTPDGRHASSDIDLFTREGSRWHRHRERVEEVAWPKDEIRRVFREAGFDTLRAWDASPFFGIKSVVKPGCRTIYLAHKPDQPRKQSPTRAHKK